MNERDAVGDGVVIEQVATFGVVQSVDDDIHASKKRLGIPRVEMFHTRMQASASIDLPKALSCGLRLRRGTLGVALGIERLPLEIAPLDRISIDERQRADASPHQPLRLH